MWMYSNNILKYVITHNESGLGSPDFFNIASLNSAPYYMVTYLVLHY